MRATDKGLRELAEELRHVRLVTGGIGCFLLVKRRLGRHDTWISDKAYWALHEAASQMGLGGLPGAVWRGALPDVITEAIEALEADPLDPVEIEIEVAC